MIFESRSASRKCLQLKLFAAERRLLAAASDRVEVRLRDFELHRPRQWGGCWLFSELWKELQLDEFWRARLGCSREGTNWEHVLQILVCYRLLDPGSEWRLHRVWFEQSAMGDLLAEDLGLHYHWNIIQSSGLRSNDSGTPYFHRFTSIFGTRIPRQAID